MSEDKNSDKNNKQSGQAVLEPSMRMKQLVEMSHNISVDRNIPVTQYFKSGRELIRAAATFEAKGDIEKAFVLYLRYMTLFLEKLIHHPEYSKADKSEKKLVKDECNHVFDLAEELKKRIIVKYEKEYENSKGLIGDKSNTAANTDSGIKKRSVESQGSSSYYNPDDVGVDEIDKKFDFSLKPSQDDSTQSKAFDPFNIEELKLSFASSNQDSS